MGRDYTTEEKAQAVALAASVGPLRAAKQLGIPKSTVVYWQRQPAASVIVAQAHESIAEQLRSTHAVALAEVRAGLLDPKARLGDKAAALRILGEQLQLAEGRATQNIELHAAIAAGQGDDPLTDAERFELQAYLDQTIARYDEQHPEDSDVE